VKRIVIDARESGTSTGRYVDKLIEYLHRLKPDYEVLLLAKPHRQDFLKGIAPNFGIVPCPIKEFTFAEQLKLLKQIKSLKADLVHFPMVQQPVLYRGLTVTTMQDLTTIRFRNPAKNWLVFNTKREVYKWVNKRVARKSKLLIAISGFVKNDVADYCGVSPDKITVTYEAADRITEAPKSVPGVKEPFILYVGRPAANKNLARLIDAFKILRPGHPELQLVFTGKLNSEYRRLQKHAAGDKDIVFTDFASEAQLRWLYENAKAYVFPSLSEGFGLPGLEAMQYGLPVVSSNATCLPEIYQDAAVYFDPLNTQDMAKQISAVLDDPKLARQLASKGSALVKTYSWQRMAQQTLDVYKKALGD
jgi:glycosyltransferase involved in cell wall biosynthesis